MKVLVLLAEDDPDAWQRASEEQRAAVFDAHDLIEVADLDVALEFCRLLAEGYTVEVRPAVEVSTG